LFTSSLGASWNDLPLTPLYLPLVHQMIRYIGNREAESWHALGETFRVEKEPQGAAPAVDSPDGARLNENRLTPEGDLLVTGKQPGFYRLRYADRPDFAAVNLNANEGDFTKLDFGAFISGVTGGAGNAGSAATTAVVPDKPLDVGKLDERLEALRQRIDERKKTLDARRQADQEKIRIRWGALVNQPAVVAELKTYGERVARLTRIRELAEVEAKPAIADRAKKALALENARHEKQMNALAAGGAK